MNLVDNAFMHLFDDPGRVAHIDNFLRAFHGALPVHKAGAIREFRVRQVLEQRGIGRCSEVIVVHLDPDWQAAKAEVGQSGRKIIHRVALV